MSITEACTNYFPVLMSITEACTNYFPVLLCTAKFAQTTSQYYFALQSLHKLLPGTDVYYRSLHELLPSTDVYYRSLHKLLPSTDVYYRSLHKLLPSTTLYCKVCTNYFAVLLCTTKLAQTTSQY